MSHRSIHFSQEQILSGQSGLHFDVPPSRALPEYKRCSPEADHSKSLLCLSLSGYQKPLSPDTWGSCRPPHDTLRPASVDHNDSSIYEPNQLSLSFHNRKISLPSDFKYEQNPYLTESSRIYHDSLDTTSSHIIVSRPPVMIYPAVDDVTVQNSKPEQSLSTHERSLMPALISFPQPVSNLKRSVVEESCALPLPSFSGYRIVHGNSCSREALDLQVSTINCSRSDSRGLEKQDSIRLRELGSILPISSHQTGPGLLLKNHALKFNVYENHMVINGAYVSEGDDKMLQKTGTASHQTISSLSFQDNETLTPGHSDKRAPLSRQFRSQGHTPSSILAAPHFLTSINPSSVRYSTLCKNPGMIVCPPALQDSLWLARRDRGREQLCEEKCIIARDQSKSSADSRHFKKWLLRDRNPEDDFPVRLPGDGAFSSKESEKLYNRQNSVKLLDATSMHNIDKSCRTVLPDQHFTNNRMMDIEMTDVSVGSDVIQYPSAASASSASSYVSRAASTRPYINRKKSVWRPYLSY